MRKIAANYVFPVTSAKIKNGVVVLDNNGKINEIINNSGELIETSGLEFYNGIITPGFVNVKKPLDSSQSYGELKGNPGYTNLLSINYEERKALINKALMNKDNCLFCFGNQEVSDISITDTTIFNEMITIQNTFSSIPFISILSWATINGARALDISIEFGSIEIGKTPGLILIEGFDFQNNRLGEKSRIKRLI